MQENINLIGGIQIQIDDEEKRNGHDVSLLLTQYFSEGKAVHIRLDHTQVDYIFKKLKSIKEI